MTRSTGYRDRERAETLAQRFERRRIRSIRRGEGPDACWVWIGSRTVAGYGRFMFGDSYIYTHRASYEIHHGPITGGLHVLHRCDNPPCCNPAHLFLGTPYDNAWDKVRKGRHRNGEIRGTAHRLAKLDDEKVRYIRSSRETGVALAARFGVATTLICRVRQRQCWPHVA